MTPTDSTNPRLFCGHADLIATLDDPSAVVTFTRECAALDGYPLHSIPLASVYVRTWEAVPLNEPAPPRPDTKKLAAGLIIIEPDDRVWLCEPTDHFGGYQHTFPKSGDQGWPTMQQNALQAAFAKTGLVCGITAWLGDYERSTSVARYYIGHRASGAPWAFGPHTATVKLVPLRDAESLLNKKIDKKILHDVIAWIEKDKQRKAHIAALAELDLKQMEFNTSLTGIWDSWHMLEAFAHRCEVQAAHAAEKGDWTVGLHYERQHIESETWCETWREFYLQMLRTHIEQAGCTSPRGELEARAEAVEAERRMRAMPSGEERIAAANALKVALLYKVAASMGRIRLI